MIIKETVGFGVGEVGIGIERVEGIFGVERWLFFGIIIHFRKWSSELGKPEWKKSFDGRTVSGLGDELE